MHCLLLTSPYNSQQGAVWRDPPVVCWDISLLSEKQDLAIYPLLRLVCAIHTHATILIPSRPRPLTPVVLPTSLGTSTWGRLLALIGKE